MTLPELSGIGHRVRLPPGRDVVLTDRFRTIVDSEPFQRLRRIRQLGPTHLVYPGAVHTRFEHSLGVYGYTAKCIASLLRDPNVAQSLDEESIVTVLAAGLLHDIGHYPFAHSLEALHRTGKDTPRHEVLGTDCVVHELGAVLEKSLGVSGRRVASLFGVSWSEHTGVDSLLASIISSALDADKMDYLERDSAHLGVPYGQSFDVDRLLASLCVSEDGRKLAVDSKGKVPAEMFIFSRYMMFSEVYWHHTVRAASCMVEYALEDYLMRVPHAPGELKTILLSSSDDGLLRHIAEATPEQSVAHTLVERMLSPRRELYKRVVTYSRIYTEDWKRDAYERLYGASSAQLLECRQRMAGVLSSLVSQPVTLDDILIDTPPRDKDHPETVDVRFARAQGQTSYPLNELSRVVAGVHNDFVAVVKKIRIFMAPHVAECAREKQRPVEDALAAVIRETC